MNKHTPAPWEFKNGIIQEVSQNSETVQVKRTLASINTFGILSKESEANAKLIAAAPILLEALKQIEQMSDCGSDFLAVCRMKSIATDAIKKATE